MKMRASERTREKERKRQRERKSARMNKSRYGDVHVLGGTDPRWTWNGPRLLSMILGSIFPLRRKGSNSHHASPPQAPR